MHNTNKSSTRTGVGYHNCMCIKLKNWSSRQIIHVHVSKQFSFIHPSALCSFFTWLLLGGKVTLNLASSNYPCWCHYLHQQCEQKLVTALPNNGDGWQGREFKYRWQLFSDHHACNGKPPDKVVTWLFSWLRRGLILIMKIVQFSISVLMLNSERMVLLHLKHKIICLWFLSHHSYSDFIYHVIEIPNHILILKYKRLLKAILEFWNHFDENNVQKERVGVFDV